MTDAISRRAVLEMTSTVAAHGAKFEVIFPDDVEQLPALDVAPVVHARWVYSGYVDANGNRHANCSRCGAGEEHKEEWTDKVPYCWKCGARMDGEADG